MPSFACCGFCLLSLADFGEQLAECDDRLFNRICHNPQHILHRLLLPPSAASQNCRLQSSWHDRQLLQVHTSHLMDCEFITRILYSVVMASEFAYESANFFPVRSSPNPWIFCGRKWRFRNVCSKIFFTSFLKFIPL